MAFADDPSQARRQQVWGDWLTLTAALRSAVGAVPAAWLSGSFLTNKAEPGDVDCVYVVESSVLLAARVDAVRVRFLSVVARSEVKSAFGLLVDSYILEWMPKPGVGRTVAGDEYLANRGYWDELWSRERSVDAREDSVPRRGYVEVILDGYK